MTFLKRWGFRMVLIVRLISMYFYANTVLVMAGEFYPLRGFLCFCPRQEGSPIPSLIGQGEACNPSM